MSFLGLRKESLNQIRDFSQIDSAAWYPNGKAVGRRIHAKLARRRERQRVVRTGRTQEGTSRVYHTVRAVKSPFLSGDV